MATMNTGIVRESESKGTRSLLQCHGSERPQHKSHEEADEPHDAVGDAANAGRKDLGGERRARAPKTQEAEAPGEAEDPEPKVACRIDPEGHEDRAPDQQRDEADAPAVHSPKKPTRPQKT